VNAPTLTCETHALVEHYEALREDIIDPNRRGQRVRGLALLVRKGMAAWMKGVSEHPASLIPSVPAITALPLPNGVEQPLVDILAAMALATAWEVPRDRRDSLESASPAPQAKRLSVRASIDAAAGV
jgi:hypothetical protein